MGRVAGIPNWYDVLGRRIVCGYVAAYYVEGSQARSLKYCWRRQSGDGCFMNLHTFLKYVPRQPDGRVDLVVARAVAVSPVLYLSPSGGRTRF